MQRIISFLLAAVFCGTILYGQSILNDQLPGNGKGEVSQSIHLACSSDYIRHQPLLKMRWAPLNRFQCDAFLICRQGLPLGTTPVEIVAVVDSNTDSYNCLPAAEGYYYILAITNNPITVVTQSNVYAYFMLVPDRNL